MPEWFSTAAPTGLLCGHGNPLKRSLSRILDPPQRGSFRSFTQKHLFLKIPVLQFPVPAMRLRMSQISNWRFDLESFTFCRWTNARLPEIVLLPRRGFPKITANIGNPHFLSLSVFWILELERIPPPKPIFLQLVHLFCHCVGIQEWCLNAISVDKGYLVVMNSIECYSFSVISW